MTLTPDTKATVTLGVVVTLIVSGWAVSEAFGSKADKKETDSIWTEVNQLKKERAVDSAIQQNILKLLEKMDTRMERMENKQDWQIQENLKRWKGDFQPPQSTPAPNPLNR